MHLPISYNSDRRKAEQILLDVVSRHTTAIKDLGEPAIAELERRYFVKRSDLEPKVYMRLTDNWVELAVRFIVEDHGIRDVKNRISRDVLDALDQAGIGIASGTYEIVGMPPLKVEVNQPQSR